MYSYQIEKVLYGLISEIISGKKSDSWEQIILFRVSRRLPDNTSNIELLKELGKEYERRGEGFEFYRTMNQMELNTLWRQPPTVRGREPFHTPSL
jgi:hypothetical protein